MKPASYKVVNDLVSELLTNIQQVLGKRLIGLYLYGSATAGDFDMDISDIDLLAAVASDITETEFSKLEEMHNNFAQKHPRWRDRIEVAYLSLHGLQTFKTERSQIVVISPGEPLNVHDAGYDWLINWYVIQENGITIFGPNPTSLIPKISKDEYIEWVKKQTALWTERAKEYAEQSPRASVAYAVLTMCRAMYAVCHGQQVSKNRAVSWVKKEFPQWAALLDLAIAWRKRQWEEEQGSVGSELQQVIEFLDFAIDYVLNK
jgi:predicted nucleotidyltransferase